MQWWCVQLLLPSSKKKCRWWSCSWSLMPLQLLSLFVSKSKHLANARCLQWSRMPGRVRVFVVEQMVHFFPRLHELPRWDMPKREELFGAHSHWPPQLFCWASLLSVSSSSFKIKEAGISMHLPKLWSAGWAHSEFPSEVYTRTSLCCIAIRSSESLHSRLLCTLDTLNECQSLWQGHGMHIVSVNFITPSSILLAKWDQSGMAGGSQWGISLISDWASVASTNQNTTLSQIKINEYDENTSTTSKSVKCGMTGSCVYHDCTIPWVQPRSCTDLHVF